jgi:hypothetical protein
MQRKAWKLSGHLLSAACVVLLVRVALHAGEQATEVNFSLAFAAALLFAVLTGVAGHALLGVCWWLQFSPSVRENSVRRFIQGTLSTQIAKYLPGNVFHLVGRGIVLRDLLSPRAVSLSLLMEMLLIACSALLVASVLADASMLGALADVLPGGRVPWVPLVIGLAAVGSFFFIYHQSRRTTDLGFGLGRGLVVITLFGLMFLVHGLAIWCLFVTSPGDGVSWATTTAVFSLAFLVGYLLPGAPGGLGVREYAFVTLAAPSMGPGAALQLIVVYRITSIIADAAAYAVSRLPALVNPTVPVVE